MPLPDTFSTYALGPDGKRFAHLVTEPARGRKQVKLLAVPGGKELQTVTLEQGNEANLPSVQIALIGSDKLLAITETSGFVLTDIPSGRRLAKVDGPFNVRDVFAGKVNRTVSGYFAVAEGGGTLALFTGKGYACYDTATGKPITLDVPSPFLAWGIALSPDGKRLAAGVRLGDKDKGTDKLFLFDVAGGKAVAAVATQVQSPMSARLMFCGPDHLQFGGINGNDVELWTVAGDKPTKQATIHSYLPPLTAGGFIYRGRKPGYKKGVEPKPYQFYRVAVPPADLGPDLWLYEKGFVKGPMLED